LTFLDGSGKQVGTASGSKDPGYHTATTSLSLPGFGTFPGMVFWAGFSRPIPAPPGAYTVRLTADGQTDTKTLHVLKDPRVPATEKDLQEQYEFSQEIVKRVNDANTAVLRIRDEKAQIDTAIGDAKATPEVKSQGGALKEKLTAIEGEIHQYRSKSGEDPLNFPIKLNDQLAGVLGFVLSGQMAPPQQAREAYAILTKALDVQLNALGALEKRELDAFNATLRRTGLTPVVPKNPPLSNPAPRRRGGGEEEQEGG
jgi:hypothetical protein